MAKTLVLVASSGYVPGDSSFRSFRQIGRRARLRGGRDPVAAESPEVTSVMRATISRQPEDLRTLLADRRPVETVAERLSGRRIVAVGTGTSWHAANHAVGCSARRAVEARPVKAMDAAQHGLPVGEGDAVLVMSRRNTKRFSTEVLDRERAVLVP